MNFVELQNAVASDTHREDYLLTVGLIPRFIAFGESLIKSRLESYPLQYQFTDADRVAPQSPVYLLPAKVALVRHVLVNSAPLEAVDETLLAQYRSASVTGFYCLRPKHIVFAGTPGDTALLDMNYFGLPAALVNDTDTNALLDDYPQLYIDASAVYVFRRAQDYDSAQAAFSAANGMIDQINRKMKKLLGGARSSNPYNVSTRSSY